MILTILKIIALYITICGFLTLFVRDLDISKTKLFLITLALTPIGIGFYVYYKRKIQEKHFHHRCPRCKYYFTENISNCPICAKEGVNLKLTKLEIYYGIKS